MNGKRWLPHHTQAMIEMNKLGCDDAMIAKHIGHCPDTVQRHRSALGILPATAMRYGTWADLTADALKAIERETRDMWRAA